MTRMCKISKGMAASSIVALATALVVSGAADAAPAKLIYDPVATAISASVEPETANLALDEAMAGAEYCPVVMDVEVNHGATVDLLLLAPCVAGQHVELKYGLKRIALQASASGALITSLPFVATDRVFTVSFEDGRTIETDLLAPGAVALPDENLAMR